MNYIKYVFSFFICLTLHISAQADDYDLMREKHFILLTGGTSYNPADPAIATIIDSIEARASSHWSTMNKSSSRTYIWDSYPTRTGPNVNYTYQRLQAMALAYATNGSSLQGNLTLKTDIISALDWLYANWYNETLTFPNNWFEWELSIPFSLNDIMVLMYNDFTATQLTNYINVIDNRNPDAGIYHEGANRVWKCNVVLLRGIIGKSSAKIIAARSSIGNEFPYKDAAGDDGFYTDGSFVQHGKYAYTGGYGKGLLADIVKQLYLYNGSAWPVTDPNAVNVYKWVFDSFEPLIYKGGIMSMVQGREISRFTSTEHNVGHSIMLSVLRLAQFAPATSLGTGYPANTALAMKQMVKYWINADTFKTYSPTSISTYLHYQALMNDSGITPRSELVKHKRFPGMDRVVHLRPGYGFGISMFSSRIANYELINFENKNAYHTADGMTYLYNNDLGQFSGNYWPTVDEFRMPGTTVFQNTYSPSARLNSQPWVGGADLSTGFGVTGMSQQVVSSEDASVPNLFAKKSWFMFDDEIVALGAGISTTAAKIVETVVENRKLTSGGNNPFTVNGTAKSTSLGWSETMSGVNWAHLAGNVSGSDIGYYFPTAVTLKAKREVRTGKWTDINTYPPTDPATYTNNFLTAWLDHGTSPTTASYGYVLLPGKTVTQMSNYAPAVTILKNTRDVQAVKENGLNVIGANFWKDTLQSVDVGANYPAFITCNKQAAVMVDQDASTVEIAVSDPTQLNTGTIEVEVKMSASSLISKASQITVVQSSPTIRLSVNVNGAKGRTFRAKFNLGSGARLSAEENQESELGVSMQIYPNPAQKNFMVSFYSDREQEATLQVTDLKGVVVSEAKNLLLKSGQNLIPVKVSKAPNGMYVVRVTNSQHVFSQKVLIIP